MYNDDVPNLEIDILVLRLNLCKNYDTIFKLLRYKVFKKINILDIKQKEKKNEI